MTVRDKNMVQVVCANGNRISKPVNICAYKTVVIQVCKHAINYRKIRKDKSWMSDCGGGVGQFSDPTRFYDFTGQEIPGRDRIRLAVSGRGVISILGPADFQANWEAVFSHRIGSSIWQYSLDIFRCPARLLGISSEVPDSLIPDCCSEPFQSQTSRIFVREIRKLLGY